MAAAASAPGLPLHARSCSNFSQIPSDTRTMTTLEQAISDLQEFTSMRTSMQELGEQYSDQVLALVLPPELWRNMSCAKLALLDRHLRKLVEAKVSFRLTYIINIALLLLFHLAFVGRQRKFTTLYNFLMERREMLGALSYTEGSPANYLATGNVTHSCVLDRLKSVSPSILCLATVAQRKLRLRRRKLPASIAGRRLQPPRQCKQSVTAGH